MKRGEIWTVSGGGYADKPRPAVIIQDDRFDGTASVTICAFTTDPAEAPLFRPLIAPSAGNGLKEPSRLMADKLTAIAKERLGKKIGQLDAADLVRLEQAILVFLGLA